MAGGVNSRIQIRCEWLCSTLARCTDELEQLPIPFGVDTRMEVVHRPGWNLYPRLDRGCIEIEQAVGPTVRPGLHQGSNHLKIPVPALGVQLHGFFTQTKPLREPLQCRDPRPELVYIATEVDDGCGDLFVSQPRLIWSNQPKDTGDEVVSGWIDVDFGRDAVPGSPLFVGETDPHQL